MDNLSLDDNYKPLDVYFKKANGEMVKRSYSKGERRNSNQTMPRDDIIITKHGLKIPVDVADYDKFVVKMRTCEQEFKREFEGHKPLAI